uniref:Uncharacterized protein n=1 Tax=Ackermannviridae sp. TaxID=2831612 RepID=A0A8S5VKJ2_9CAUD|nr:MAG TPA: hypothetical protein [Ackermannviridae sp.]
MSTIATVFTVTFALTGLSSLLAAVIAKSALKRLNNSDRAESPYSFSLCDFYELNSNLQSNLATEHQRSQTDLEYNYNWAKSTLGIAGSFKRYTVNDLKNTYNSNYSRKE